jgi:hypothetical protein
VRRDGRWRVLENKALRRISELKKEEVRGSCRSHIIRILKISAFHQMLFRRLNQGRRDECEYVSSMIKSTENVGT